VKLVIFGLSVSSSWGNGHATLWRGLCAALAKRGHRVVFFERDVPYYAAHRDLFALPGGELIFYESWAEVCTTARRHLSDCDVAVVTSYCPDANPASQLVLDSPASVHCFYDLDSPVTLDRVERGLPVDYIGPRGLADFDLVLSYAGGRALEQLQSRLGARAVAPLYGSVDPRIHHPAEPEERYRADLSYLGTNAPDRDQAVRALFVNPAKQLPHQRFVLGGAMYDDSFPWQPNIFLVSHVPSANHPAFFCSARLNLNVTRRAMAENGYCPSGRLFEAAACGAAILTDNWAGLDAFFEPGHEILVANGTGDVMEALQSPPKRIAQMGRAARERTLEHHTADVRVLELESILDTFRANSGDLPRSMPVVAEAS
jgi:spore maturation protein CgeB